MAEAPKGARTVRLSPPPEDAGIKVATPAPEKPKKKRAKKAVRKPKAKKPKAAVKNGNLVAYVVTKDDGTNEYRTVVCCSPECTEAAIATAKEAGADEADIVVTAEVVTECDLHEGVKEAPEYTYGSDEPDAEASADAEDAAAATPSLNLTALERATKDDGKAHRGHVITYVVEQTDADGNSEGEARHTVVCCGNACKDIILGALNDEGVEDEAITVASTSITRDKCDVHPAILRMAEEARAALGESA